MSVHVPLHDVLTAIKRAVESKDPYTAGHNEHVAIYSVNLARAIGLKRETLRDIAIGAQLHDVGKIGTADALLNKPGRLTSEERSTIQQHCVVGHRLCETLNLPKLSSQLIRGHHERLNGSGYPDGLRGNAIPVGLQVTCLVDVVDALLSARVYRPAMNMADVWNIIADEAALGLHDHELVGECIRLMATGELFCSISSADAGPVAVTPRLPPE